MSNRENALGFFNEFSVFIKSNANDNSPRVVIFEQTYTDDGVFYEDEWEKHEQILKEYIEEFGNKIHEEHLRYWNKVRGTEEEPKQEVISTDPVITASNSYTGKLVVDGIEVEYPFKSSIARFPNFSFFVRIDTSTNQPDVVLLESYFDIPIAMEEPNGEQIANSYKKLQSQIYKMSQRINEEYTHLWEKNYYSEEMDWSFYYMDKYPDKIFGI